MAIGGYVVGKSTDDDGSNLTPADASRARAEGVAAGHERGLVEGQELGYAKGRRAGIRTGRKQERRRQAEQVPPSSPDRPRDQGGDPSPNTDSPPGQEPTAGGGCKPYDEMDGGQIEPRINDPRCYKPNPPDPCF
jgi:hypothetical protein